MKTKTKTADAKRRTGYPFDVSVKAVEGGEATTVKDSTTSTQSLCGVMPGG